jgi:putative methionine-R-sulfoxide reductase with GAF domain
VHNAARVLKPTYATIVWGDKLLYPAGWTLPEEWRDATMRLSEELSLRGEIIGEVRPFPSPDSAATAIVAVPIEAGGEVVGSIKFFDGDEALLSGKKRLLGFFTRGAGIAIEQAMLWRNPWEQRQDFQPFLIVDAISQLASVGHIAAMKSYLLDWILGVLGAHRGSIMLLDESKSYLTIDAARGIDRDIVHSTRQRFDGGISGWVLSAREPLLLTEVRDDPRFSGVAPHIKASLVVPLTWGGEALGTVAVADTTGLRTYTEEDLEVMLVAANYLAEEIALAKEVAIAPELPAVEVQPPSRIKLYPGTFQKLLTLTTALGNVGLSKEGFGFSLTAGSFVAQEENRECVLDVGGIGFTQLSRELAQRLQELGEGELPVQIIDNGSGKLKLYISPPL